MNKKILSFIKLIMTVSILLILGFFAKKIMKVDALSYIGVPVTLQYFIFSVIIGFFMVSSCCFGYFTVSIVSFLLSIIATAYIYYFNETPNVTVYWLFFPIVINLISQVFYFFWISPFSMRMRGLQFALLASLIYSVSIIIVLKILQVEFVWADFFTFLLNSLAFFITLSVGLAMSSLLSAYIDMKVYGEEIEEVVNNEFEELDD